MPAPGRPSSPSREQGGTRDCAALYLSLVMLGCGRLPVLHQQ